MPALTIRAVIPGMKTGHGGSPEESGDHINLIDNIRCACFEEQGTPFLKGTEEIDPGPDPEAVDGLNTEKIEMTGGDGR